MSIFILFYFINFIDFVTLAYVRKGSLKMM